MRQTHALVATLILVAACSDDSTGPSTTLTSQQRADVAAAMGEATSSDIDAMARTGTSSSVLFGFSGDLGNGVCTSVLGNLVCTATAGTLSGEATLKFRDDADQPQTAYDAGSTASVMIDTDVEGDVSHSGFTFDLDHEAALTATGLAGAETSRTWDGTGSSTMANVDFAGSRSYTIHSASDYQTVVVPTTGDGPNWPASGRVSATVQIDIVGGANDGEQFTTAVQIDFNGTATVPMLVGDAAFTLHLNNHQVTSGPES